MSMPQYKMGKQVKKLMYSPGTYICIHLQCQRDSCIFVYYPQFQKHCLINAFLCFEICNTCIKTIDQCTRAFDIKIRLKKTDQDFQGNNKKKYFISQIMLIM